MQQRTSQREVMLQCPGGRLLRHIYTHIDSCLCQDTMCELPPWRRARRSGLRAPGPGAGVSGERSATQAPPPPSVHPVY